MTADIGLRVGRQVAVAIWAAMRGIGPVTAGSGPTRVAAVVGPSYGLAGAVL